MKKHLTSNIQLPTLKQAGRWLGRSLALPVAALILLGGSLASQAQSLIFGSGQTITGTTNSSAVDTNTAVVQIRPSTFSIVMPPTLICTNAIANIFLSTSATSITNALLVGSWQGSGFNSTNVSTGRFTTNAPVYTLLQVQLGTNAPQVYYIWGP